VLLLCLLLFWKIGGDEIEIFVANYDGVAMLCAATLIVHSADRASPSDMRQGQSRSPALVILMDTALVMIKDCVNLT
jgi:hypothetical protein